MPAFVQADLSGALTAYIGIIPIAITYAPANAAAGVAFDTSVQFPPNNQLSAQASTSQISIPRHRWKGFPASGILP